jgi:hypothetical protein
VDQPQQEPPASLTVLGGVELCGSAKAAEEYLKPKDEKKLKRWTKDRSKVTTNKSGETVVGFKFYELPDAALPVFGNQTPSGVNIHERNGRVEAVDTYWAAVGKGRKDPANFWLGDPKGTTYWTPGVQAAVWKDIEEKFTQAKGLPDQDRANALGWFENGKSTFIEWTSESVSPSISIRVVCTQGNHAEESLRNVF